MLPYTRGSVSLLSLVASYDVARSIREALAEGDRPDFEEFHTQFWVGQQERAFINWLNITIIPHAVGRCRLTLSNPS